MIKIQRDKLQYKLIKPMKILVAGDFCPRGRVSQYINEEDYFSVLGETKSIIDDVDYSFVNLECPVVEHDALPIEKCGPNLKCSQKAVEALRWVGFNCVTLANNHFLDYGEIGVRDTLTTCKSIGLDYVGGGMNMAEASNVLYKDINGSNLAIINSCEQEFSIATETTPGSNPLNVVQQYYAIQQARKKANYIVVIIHGGVEHFWLPSPRMKETYRFFIDAGADAVVNHHQHCYSGYEIYKGKPIFYGIGNYCFDGNSENERWTTGFMICLNLNDGIIDYDLIPYKQCYHDEVGVHLLMQEDIKLFQEKIINYNDIIADEALNYQKYLQWCRINDYNYKYVLNPLYNRYTKAFFESSLCRKYFRKKWVYAKDMIGNESHVTRLLLSIDNLLEKK